MNHDEPRRAEVQSIVAGAGLDPRMVALLAGMRECACGLDHEWRVAWANAQAARHVGVPLDEAIGAVLWSLFPSAVGTHLEALFRRAVTEQKPQWADLLSPITGLWVDMRVFPTPEGVVLVWSDLTERREEMRTTQRTAAERDAALAKLEAVLNLLPVGVGIAEDPACAVVKSNPAYARMLGLPPEAAARPASPNAAGTNGPDALPGEAGGEPERASPKPRPAALANGPGALPGGPAGTSRAPDADGPLAALADGAAHAIDADERLDPAWRLVLRDGRPLAEHELPLQVAARTGAPVPTAEYTVVRGDGARIVITGAALPLHDAAGHPTGAVGTFTDVTDLEAALTAVEAHAAFLAALGDTVPGLLWAADGGGRLEYGNRALETYFGKPTDALDIGVWWTASHPEHAGAVELAWERAHATGEPLELEYPLRRADGEHRWFLVRATPHVDAGVRRWVGLALDVTERRRTAEQLHDTQRLQAVGKLAGGVAHEVNNQMTVVIGMAALALKWLGQEHSSRRAIEQVMAAGQRSANITRQLLAFSRRQVLQPELLDLNDVLFAFRPVLERIVGAHTTVRVDVAPGPLLVRADRGQLEQVLVNLASNSRDAMPGGGRLTVRSGPIPDGDVRRLAGNARPGPWVALSVEDTGSGMTPDVRTRAFEPFFSTRRHGEGTGLGLATVYGIVTQSGGLLTLDSEPGRGTTVHVFLPAAEGAVEADLPAPAPGSTRWRRAPARARGLIVVAEDEDGVRELVGEVLTGAGYEVLAAGSGDEALRLVADLPAPPALLLTDVVMPGMGGRELATRVCARSPVPVLYVSGYAWDEVVRRGLLEDRAPFLQKPFGPDSLLAAVGDVLGGFVVALD